MHTITDRSSAQRANPFPLEPPKRPKNCRKSYHNWSHSSCLKDKEIARGAARGLKRRLEWLPEAHKDRQHCIASRNQLSIILLFTGLATQRQCLNIDLRVCKIYEQANITAQPLTLYQHQQKQPAGWLPCCFAGSRLERAMMHCYFFVVMLGGRANQIASQ